MAKIKFGGPKLPPDSVTWYDHINPDGTVVDMVRIRPGATIDEERVRDAQSYIDREMATRIEVVATAPAQMGTLADS